MLSVPSLTHASTNSNDNFPILSVAILCLLAYLVGGAIYRLYLSPLAKFPGPKLAALTGWYEFYYDIVKRGQFIWKLKELHEKYGPIVRITPHELHIRDADYYDELYASAAKRRDKYGPWVALAGAPGASFSTVSHDLHRLRRGAINPFFSKKYISTVQPLIFDKISRLCKRFEDAMQTGEVVRLDAAYMALTMDVITQYAYGESYNYLAEDDFKLEWKETVVGGSANGAFLRQFPWALPILKGTPMWLLKIMNPQAAMLVGWQHMVRRQVEGIMEMNREGKKADNTIFQTLLDSDLPPEEKSIDRLQDEGQTLVGAGSETTAKSLSIITFYLLNDPNKLRRLREELQTVMPTPTTEVTWQQLEQLPYLTACINEGVRLMFGVTTRLPRVSPHEVLHYKDYDIPPGTPVSSSNYFVHTDPAIFPDPLSFKPERWLSSPPAPRENQKLSRYMVSFSKGSRQCVGINLAYAELYLTLAVVIRRFEMELFETDESDVRVARDFFVGVPKLDTKGVRAKIVGLVKE